MFDTPKQDINFLKADNSGITHNPHPQSSTKPEDRYFYLNYKATVDFLTGSHLTVTAQRYQTALNRRIEVVPIQDKWVDLDDLFSFLRPLIFDSSIETMCGVNFLRTFPDFVDNFWKFNDRMSRLLQGWPRWMIPKTWRARDRCISLMKQWRKMSLEKQSNAHPFFLRRWSDFSKMRGFSEDGAASSDLGVLWAYVTSQDR